MSISNIEKQKLIKQYAKHGSDTGSTEVQIAVLTTRIKNLTTHLSPENKGVKDNHSRRGMEGLINKRRTLLKYYKSQHADKYAELLASLGIRK